MMILAGGRLEREERREKRIVYHHCFIIAQARNFVKGFGGLFAKKACFFR
jgi:hypothetical protein